MNTKDLDEKINSYLFELDRIQFNNTQFISNLKFFLEYMELSKKDFLNEVFCYSMYDVVSEKESSEKQFANAISNILSGRKASLSDSQTLYIYRCINHLQHKVKTQLKIENFIKAFFFPASVEFSIEKKNELIRLFKEKIDEVRKEKIEDIKLFSRYTDVFSCTNLSHLGQDIITNLSLYFKTLRVLAGPLTIENLTKKINENPLRLENFEKLDASTLKNYETKELRFSIQNTKTILFVMLDIYRQDNSKNELAYLLINLAKKNIYIKDYGIAIQNHMSKDVISALWIQLVQAYGKRNTKKLTDKMIYALDENSIIEDSPEYLLIQLNDEDEKSIITLEDDWENSFPYIGLVRKTGNGILITKSIRKVTYSSLKNIFDDEIFEDLTKDCYLNSLPSSGVFNPIESLHQVNMFLKNRCKKKNKPFSASMNIFIESLI